MWIQSSRRRESLCNSGSLHLRGKQTHQYIYWFQAVVFENNPDRVSYFMHLSFAFSTFFFFLSFKLLPQWVKGFSRDDHLIHWKVVFLPSCVQCSAVVCTESGQRQLSEMLAYLVERHNVLEMNQIQYSLVFYSNETNRTLSTLVFDYLSQN